MSWIRHDDDFCQTVHKLQVDSEHPHHEVRIFSKLETYKRLKHYVQIYAGPYGKTVYETELPFGTKLSEAKLKAVEIAKKSNRDGKSSFLLGN